MRIYEINTRVHCSSFDQITDDELEEYSRLGFDAIWLMGVWQISDGVRRFSKVVSDDFEGSPYALPDYQFNTELGGKEAFLALARRAHRAGHRVIVDFVSNHMAVDTPWIDQHPDFFITSNTQARKQSTSEFFLHPSGKVIAFGRDPYFPPWHDTAQLDYANPALRSHLIEILKQISQVADGVRCDMAMLVLKNYFRHLWYPHAPESWFNEMMPGEFWAEAIQKVKAVNPDFKFIAEAYWDTETYLIELGFDLVYEKKTYDGLSSRNFNLVLERLVRTESILRRSLFFIENHDEPRAADIFSRENNLAALALILTLPGSSLIYEGQIEGKRERLPVQRIKPLKSEPVDQVLKRSYHQILPVTSDEIFKEGSFHLFDNGVPGIISLLRRHKGRSVAYIGQVSESLHPFNSALLDLTPLAQSVNAKRYMLIKNLLGSTSLIVEEVKGRFHARLEHLGIEIDTTFCLLEAAAPK